MAAFVVHLNKMWKLVIIHLLVARAMCMLKNPLPHTVSQLVPSSLCAHNSRAMGHQVCNIALGTWYI